MIEILFETRSPLGEPLVLYKNRWAGEDEHAETLSLVTGLHGNRLTGLYVVSRLAGYLDSVQAGTGDGSRLMGQVQLFPVVNLRAMESSTTTWSMDSLNTDLAFPGTIEGELTEKICNTLLQHTARSDFGIVLNTAPAGYNDALHVELNKKDRALRQLSRAFGINAARLRTESPDSALRLVKHWQDCHIQSITLSAGRAHHLDRVQGDAMFEGILNFMRMAGILSHPTLKGNKNEVDFYNPKGEIVLSARHAGLFIPEAVPGPVSAGQIIGEIRGLYNGKVFDTPTVPKDGFLVTLRDNPLVCEGELLGTVMTERYPRWFWPFG